MSTPVFLVSEKKSNHQANIVRVTEVIPHPNADRLELIRIDGYQCVVRKDDFQPGDLAVYIQPDSIVPETEPFRFIWGEHIPTLAGDPGGTAAFPIPARKRRVTVRKFRGEWSEGLLLPLADFLEEIGAAVENLGGTITLEPGTDVSDIIGVTHYDPDAGTEPIEVKALWSKHAPRRKWPKTLRGWFLFLLHRLGFQRATSGYALEVGFKLPVYDVESLKNHPATFQKGESIIITEKIHGSNARFVFLDDVMYRGSRAQWKAPGGNDVWNQALDQNPWIERWCREHPGTALYGEVTPTQKGFDYGCKKGQAKFFLFDIRSPQGYWVPVCKWVQWGIHPNTNSTVPLYYEGPYVHDTFLHALADGMSMVPGALHMREGIVIKSAEERRTYGLGRVQLKLVSNRFLEADSQVC